MFENEETVKELDAFHIQCQSLKAAEYSAWEQVPLLLLF